MYSLKVLPLRIEEVGSKTEVDDSTIPLSTATDRAGSVLGRSRLTGRREDKIGQYNSIEHLKILSI